MTPFHNVFYAIFILKAFNSPISVVACNFFEFVTVSKWSIREWVKRVYTPASTLTETSILYTDGHTDIRMDGQTG